MAKQVCNSNDEYSKLIKVLNYRLPYKFKKIGFIAAVLIFAYLIGYKFWGGNNLIMPDVLRTLVLFFLMIASLSRDSLEDEFNTHIRHQSYVLSFVCTTVYYISLPLVAIVLDVLITKITGDGTVSFYEVSAFEVLFLLLCFQLLFFETLKRLGRA